MATLRELVSKLVIDDKQATTTLKKHDKQLGHTKKSMLELNQTLELLSKGFGLLRATVGRVIGILARGIHAIVNVNISFEKLQASLKTVTGSSQAAARAFGLIRKIASQTPFSVQQVSDAFIKLKALGLDPSEKSIISFGNTASAMGKDLNDMIEAVADATTGEFERLKEFGIKSSSEGDRVRFTFQGVTTEVGKNAEEIQAFLLGIGETQFAGAMAQQMNTLDGIISNLMDNVELFALQVGEAGFLGALKEVGVEIRDMVGSGGDLAKVIGEFLGEAVRSTWRLIKRLASGLKDITSEDVKGWFDKVWKTVSQFGEVLSTVASILEPLTDRLHLVAGALIAMKIATIAATGPWGALAFAAVAAGAAIAGALADVTPAIQDARFEVIELGTELRALQRTRRMLEEKNERIGMGEEAISRLEQLEETGRLGEISAEEFTELVERAQAPGATQRIFGEAAAGFEAKRRAALESVAEQGLRGLKGKRREETLARAAEIARGRGGGTKELGKAIQQVRGGKQKPLRTGGAGRKGRAKKKDPAEATEEEIMALLEGAVPGAQMGEILKGRKVPKPTAPVVTVTVNQTNVDVDVDSPITVEGVAGMDAEALANMVVERQGNVLDSAVREAIEALTPAAVGR